ncbi:hypothetical protein CP532_3525 [Ophiocordyceps camponoti-leonardi (nom. inval.)]|nr:hypothetical protein CP532_3525 [Ophiocordyceps camponoti-leonardi (nom. inval.)]
MAGRDRKALTQKALTLPQLTDVDPISSPSSRDTCGWNTPLPATQVRGVLWTRSTVSSAAAGLLSEELVVFRPDAWKAKHETMVMAQESWTWSGEAAPYCKTDVFASDSMLNGYSLFVCGTDRRTDTVFRFTSSTASSSSVSLSASSRHRESEASQTLSSNATVPTSRRRESPSLTSLVATTRQTLAPPQAHTFPASPWNITAAILGSVGGLTAIAGATWLLWKLAIKAGPSGEAATQTEA